MRNPTRLILLSILLLQFTLPGVWGQPGTVEQIEVQGLYRMTREAFLHALAIKVGDPYDERMVRRRFKALWKLGLFEDISVEDPPLEKVIAEMFTLADQPPQRVVGQVPELLEEK